MQSSTSQKFSKEEVQDVDKGRIDMDPETDPICRECGSYSGNRGRRGNQNNSNYNSRNYRPRNNSNGDYQRNSRYNDRPNYRRDNFKIKDYGQGHRYRSVSREHVIDPGPGIEAP